MSAIEVNYRWTEEEYLQAADQHTRFGGGNSKDKIVAAVVGGLIVLSLFMMMERGFQPADSMAFILAIYWFFFRSRIHTRMLRSRFRKSTQQGKLISLSITDEEIQAQTEDQTEGSFDWSTVTKVVQTAQGYLMYRGVNYLWLPNVGFSSEEDAKRFGAMSERKAALFVDKTAG
ncbi:YcxB family protein [Oceanospirillum sediminis]|uniref:YcxB family protein n=1 Tax=Oceanospirillum sediminis TaxID=2760088 RepID=A0A839IVR8_9GAMM|nr:YcxB family protein [Oceanospirillum sediminis]MBB1488770.1 YcxB family protein [Oceanospirillum sediminis]